MHKLMGWRGWAVGWVCLGFACGDSGAGETDTGGSSDGSSAGPTTGSEATGETGDMPTTGETGATPTTSETGETGATSVTSEPETGSDTGGVTGTDTGVEPGDEPIGEWVDEPGVCPPGTTQVDLMTVADIVAASRGEEPFEATGPGTCFFIHDGEYLEGDEVLIYAERGGSADEPMYFIGESRDGVKLVGRASLDPGADHIVIQNLTFDLTGYDAGDDSFNTLSLAEVQDITVSHVTFTGDCMTGKQGGHIETNYTSELLVEACLIEKFGRCGPEGHEDHGVYLASGSDLRLVNNVVRGNASRGIQMYTQNGDYGTLKAVTVERNRILENGHGDQEDGIVINARKKGTISDVQIHRNLFYRNYFAGIRFSGPATSGISVQYNSFFENGIGSQSEDRSEINIDEQGLAANADISRNIFVGHALINDCYDAAGMDFVLTDNVVLGTISSGDGSCVDTVVAEDPQFVDPAGGDFHPQNPAAAGHGAYAP